MPSATKSEIDYYSLGKSLYKTTWKYARDDGRVEAEIQAVADGSGISRVSVYRALGYYRLFTKALGCSAEVYSLGPGWLDRLRKLADWDHREGTLGPGLGPKLGKAELKKYINKLLEEKRGMDAREGQEA